MCDKPSSEIVVIFDGSLSRRRGDDFGSKRPCKPHNIIGGRCLSNRSPLSFSLDTRELLFSFPSVGRLVECDLRFHGDAWGWEALIFIDDELVSHSLQHKTRAAAIQWAEQERKVLSAATSTSSSVIRRWLTRLRGRRKS